MDPAQAKQQIAERVKQASKFLVTVNNNPTVDQLAACIGLTLLLNKMGKHATAVFSGKVPSTVEFLQPEKTLEPNTDSLRDFIISLDKNKADKLRYKVEDDVVRIFITPYRTSISEKDLVFSEGDFNVEVVIALGVNQRTQLDQAITAHGRILHDATVVSVNAGINKAPDIGQINWADPAASSLSEMLVSISESFGSNLLDGQMATAFLTGIVAETERFSNAKTSPKVMTMSAQLMAAGANQQLIISKLEPPPPPPQAPPKNPPQEPPKQPPVAKAPKPKQPPLKPEGVLDVSHSDKKQDETEVQVQPTEIHIDEQGNLRTNKALAAAQQPLEEPTVAAPASAPVPVEPAPPIGQAGQAVTSPIASANPSPAPQSPAPPSGSQITKHHAYLSPVGQPSPLPSSFSSPGQPQWAAPYDLVPMDPMNQGAMDGDGDSHQPFSATTPQAAEVDELGIARPPNVAPVPPTGVDSARNAVESAFASAPFDAATAGPVQALNAQPMNIEDAEPPVVAKAAPVTPPGDTPSLNLPVESAPAPVPTPPAASITPPVPDNTQLTPDTAPPPVPPPLMAAPGAVVPNFPPPAAQ